MQERINGLNKMDKLKLEWDVGRGERQSSPMMISSVCFEPELHSGGSNNPADMRKFLYAL